jgi:hypothetical protein
MKRPAFSVNKKPAGRPPVGSTLVGVRLPPAELADLDRWIAGQVQQLTRPEAIRTLIKRRTAAKGAPKPTSTYPEVLRPFDFLERAEDCYQAFLALPEGRPPSWPRYFMLCHAIEVALKGYLALYGVTDRQLRQRDVRHGLNDLLAAATARGLQLGPARAELELLDEGHAGFWHRYPRGHDDPSAAGKPVYVIDHFGPRVRELLDAVSKSVRGS